MMALETSSRLIDTFDFIGGTPGTHCVRHLEENRAAAQVWFILENNFQMLEGAAFICSNNYMPVQT